jgi:hypothetical protein
VVLEPFRHAHSGDKEHKANDHEQKKEKFRNSRRSRSNPGKSKERSYQCDHQKNNSPTQHNDPPPSLDSPFTAILRAITVIPTTVEESRNVTLKLSLRDRSTLLGMT